MNNHKTNGLNIFMACPFFQAIEVAIGNFRELRAAQKDLRRVGVLHLHELAGCDQARLAEALGYSPEEVADLVKVSKQLLSELARQ